MLATRTSAPPVAAAGAVALAPPRTVLQRCDGATCTCGGNCSQTSAGKEKVSRDADDTLAHVLRSAVHERALQREVQTRAPADTAMLMRYCSSRRLATLQSQMHSWCDSGISCRGNMSCGDIDDRWNAGQRCLSLRQQIQHECYDDNTDAGHAEQIATVQNAIDFCDSKWRRQRC